jgi:hypothetical protein
MKKLSGFDLGIIIAFTVVALLGGAAWWYLSGQLKNSQDDVQNANSDFQKYSSKEIYLPTAANEKTLKTDITLLSAQLDPLIHDKLQVPGDRLSAVTKEESPVDWKHDLDTEVSRLNNAARLHGVTVPNNFYYGFSRYLNQNPRDEQTIILSKQLLGVEELANIFINAPVKSISTFRRTYEEDPETSAAGGGGSKSDPDMLPGRSLVAPGEIYTAYPFEIEFDGTTIAFRKVLAGMEASPYIFVLRTLALENSNPASPQIGDLDKLAGTDTPAPITDTSPGAVGDNKVPVKGPQFLFGNETLHIKVRIDMIEWKGLATDATPEAAGRSRTGRGTSREESR